MDNLTVRIMILRKNVLCAVGDGEYACLAHSPTTPNEQNCALPWLTIGKLKKLLDTFYPNKKGMNRPRNHLTLLSL